MGFFDFTPFLNYSIKFAISNSPFFFYSKVLSEAKFFNIKGILDILDKKDKIEEEINWEDIGGLDGVKQELQQLVDNTIKYKDLFLKNGVYPSKNILLYGPPGN